jgi:hypothetical protein
MIFRSRARRRSTRGWAPFSAAVSDGEVQNRSPPERHVRRLVGGSVRSSSRDVLRSPYRGGCSRWQGASACCSGTRVHVGRGSTSYESTGHMPPRNVLASLQRHLEAPSSGADAPGRDEKVRYEPKEPLIPSPPEGQRFGDRERLVLLSPVIPLTKRESTGS